MNLAAQFTNNQKYQQISKNIKKYQKISININNNIFIKIYFFSKFWKFTKNNFTKILIFFQELSKNIKEYQSVSKRFLVLDKFDVETIIYKKHPQNISNGQLLVKKKSLQQCLKCGYMNTCFKCGELIFMPFA
jgi:hypothetical protein